MLSSVKSFLISFTVAIIIFGLIGYFGVIPLLNNLFNGWFVPDENEATGTAEFEIPPVPDQEQNSGEGGAVFPGKKTFTMLFIGSDYQPGVFTDYRILVSNSTDPQVLSTHQRHYRADVLMLVKFNSDTGTVMFSSVPVNLVVQTDGLQLKLGDVFESKGADYLKDVVAGVIGMPIDYYFCCSIRLFEEIINKFGGIQYNVPVDMYYVNEEERIVTAGASRDPIPLIIDGVQQYEADGVTPKMIPAGRAFKIDLKRGIQQLSGEKATWVLRFNSYPNGFNGRRDTQISFFKAFFEQFAKEEYHGRLYEIVSMFDSSKMSKNEYDFRETNMAMTDFEEIVSTIVSYHDYEQETVVFPCTVFGIGTNESVTFSPTAVMNAYEKYKIR